MQAPLLPNPCLPGAVLLCHPSGGPALPLECHWEQCGALLVAMHICLLLNHPLISVFNVLKVALIADLHS